MSSLSSFKRNLNIEKVRIAQQKAWETAEAKKAASQKGKEIDPKLIQEVFDAIKENAKMMPIPEVSVPLVNMEQVNTDKIPVSIPKFGLGQKPVEFDVVPEKNEYK